MNTSDPGSHVARYEPPRLETLGSVHVLTELQDKQYGPTDGFTFQGVPIANASP